MSLDSIRRGQPPSRGRFTTDSLEGHSSSSTSHGPGARAFVCNRILLEIRPWQHACTKICWRICVRTDAAKGKIVLRLMRFRNNNKIVRWKAVQMSRCFMSGNLLHSSICFMLGLTTKHCPDSFSISQIRC